MGPGTGLWIMIAVICVSGAYFDYKKSSAKLSAKMDDMEDGMLQNELNQIKQRLAVLEKIITDKKYNLEEEFSSLHNHSPNDD